MTDLTIEVLARAVTAKHYAARFQKPEDDPHVQMNVDGNWQTNAETVAIILSTIEAHGYVVVPVEALQPFINAATECEGAPDEMEIGDASYEKVTVGHCRALSARPPVQ